MNSFTITGIKKIIRFVGEAENSTYFFATAADTTTSVFAPDESARLREQKEPERQLSHDIYADYDVYFRGVSRVWAENLTTSASIASSKICIGNFGT